MANPRRYDLQDIHRGLMQIGAGATGDIPAYATLVKIQPDLGAITLTLPNALEAPYQIMKIMVADVDTGAAGTTTVATLVGVLGGDLTLDADGDYVIIWSDGEAWNILIEGIA